MPMYYAVVRLQLNIHNCNSNPDIVDQKLADRLLLSWQMFRTNFVFELRIRAVQTGGRTDGRTDGDARVQDPIRTAAAV